MLPREAERTDEGPGLPAAPVPEGTSGVGHEVTAALVAARHGAPDALERLYALVYADLRAIAHRRIALEAAGHTLGTTGLVHEAYFRLRPIDAGFVDRHHFFAVAARAMRHILVDHARRHRALRRDAAATVALTTTASEWSRDADEAAARADDLIALDVALSRLGERDARLAQVVELRFFADFTEDEVARALGVTARTVRRDWTKARAWLHREVSRERA